ncbi:MAG TPA: ribonuclease J, partial [Acholeplasmataceae bacterium]|nr:ribonuclease J [Acholeplasmataceae bacterium]
SNYLNIPSDKFVNLKYIDDSNDNDYDDLVVIVTGELNEPFIHVQRMASGKDRFIKIKDTDTIVLISPHVKGYPNTFANTMNALARTNAKVINMTKKDLRSSHASPEDLKMLYMMLNPEYIAPVIGEYRHQYAHMQVALDAGYSREEILLLENGEVITFLEGKLQVAKEFVPTGDVLVDGSIVGDINSVVLKDREMLAQGGVVIINVIVDARYKEVLAEPSIVLKGVTNNKQVEADIYDIINEVVDDTLDYHFDEKYLDWQVIKKEIKDVVSKRIMKECGLSPIVLAVVLDEEK